MDDENEDVMAGGDQVTHGVAAGLADGVTDHEVAGGSTAGMYISFTVTVYCILIYFNLI